MQHPRCERSGLARRCAHVSGQVPLMEHLISQLRERQVLIVLDNFEHLLAGAPVVTRHALSLPLFVRGCD